MFGVLPESSRLVFIAGFDPTRSRNRHNSRTAVRSQRRPIFIDGHVLFGSQLEQEKMEGEWKIVRCEFSGEADAQIVGVEHTIGDNKWLRPNRRTAEYRLKFDPKSHDPKWVDLSADRLGERTLKGIYALDGDKLTICYAYDPDLPRPTEFKTTPSVVGYVYVLERVKK